jgi:hypothetical protein
MQLKGLVNVVVVGRIDTVNGGIRTTFERIPDQPISRFTLTLQGGGKGLLVNSTNLCGTHAPSVVEIDGQNGAPADQKPHLRNSCRKGKRGKHKRHRRHHRHRDVTHARKAG